MATTTISTGSNAIDALLGGGIQIGMITDIYGESASGKSQICFTLSANCAKVVTNMVRTAPITLLDQAGRNIAQAVVPSQQREYLGSSVSIYSHMKIKLEILDSLKSSFQAVLVQPAGKGSV